MPEPEPTDEQKPAIDYPGSMVAIANPGSGKTFVLARKIRVILKNAPSHRGVIAISFTNKASAELKARVIGTNLAVQASFFGTIDKFCLGEIIFPFLPHLWGKPESEISIEELIKLPDEEQHEFRQLVDFQIGLADVERLEAVFKERYRNGKVFLESCGALALYVLKKSPSCIRRSHILRRRAAA